MRVPGLFFPGGLLATVGGMCRSGVLGQSAQPTPLDAAYRQRFEKWRAELVEDRRQNWLTRRDCSG